MFLNRISPDALFPDAAEQWLTLRTLKTGRYIESVTEKNYRQYIKNMGLVFGDLRLSEIHIGHIQMYQTARLRGEGPFFRPRRPHEEPRPCPTKPNSVNQELCILRAIMRRAGAWNAELEANYEELIEVVRDLPRALSPEEQQRWLDTARSKERWQVVYLYSIVAFDTTMSTNEMRSLRLGDINLHHQTVHVPWEGSKNKYRQRSIPVESADCLWALEQLLERAHQLGCGNPTDYLFPFCIGHIHRPDRAMTVSGIKKPWLQVQTAAELKSFRMYDTRHTAITRMAEAGIPIAIIMEKAGHVSPKMTQHYTHISTQMQRKWARYAEETKKFPRPDWTYQRTRMA